MSDGKELHDKAEDAYRTALSAKADDISREFELARFTALSSKSTISLVYGKIMFDASLILTLLLFWQLWQELLTLFNYRW